MEYSTFLGSARDGNIRANVWLIGGGAIKINYEIVDDATGDTDIIGEYIYEVYRTPINLHKDLGRVDDVKEWLEDAITKSYPTPTQLKNLYYFVQNPESLLTKAIINVCKNSDCFCPLVYTALGCLEFVPTDIVSHSGVIIYKSKPFIEKKPVVLALSYIRQELPIEEWSMWMKRIEEKMSQEDIVRGEYR